MRMGSYSGQRSGASELAGGSHYILQWPSSARFRAGDFINEAGARKRRAFIDNYASESYQSAAVSSHSRFSQLSNPPQPLQKPRLPICSRDSRVCNTGRPIPCNLAWSTSNVFLLQCLHKIAAKDTGLKEPLRKVEGGEASEDELEKCKCYISEERIRSCQARQATTDEMMDIQKELGFKQVLAPGRSKSV
jgi:hypothetical protein